MWFVNQRQAVLVDNVAPHPLIYGHFSTMDITKPFYLWLNKHHASYEYPKSQFNK